MNIDFFENIIHFISIFHAIDLTDWRCWNHDHSTIFLCCFFVDFDFFFLSVILIFWIFLTVFRLIICVHDFEFVIACLAVIIETIKTINDLIELKFEKISIDLNVLWLDNFIWNDLIELIVCDFLRLCAIFVVSNLVTNLNWFLMIIFNLVCIASNSIFVSIFTIFMFSSRSWLIWLTINNMWRPC